MHIPSLSNKIKLYNNKLKEIEINDEPLYAFIDRFLKEINARRRLSEFTKLEDALKYAEIFTELVNNSGNPIKIDQNMAKKFIEDVY